MDKFDIGYLRFDIDTTIDGSFDKELILRKVKEYF